ncbi:MAG: primosomal protein N' [Phycisphaerales bacterium]
MGQMRGLFGEEGEPLSVARGGWFARVAVERGIDSGVLTYRCEERLGVGERVVVPLGRGNKKAAGIVVAAGGEELAGGFDLSRIKGIASRSGSGLSEELVELARWMSGYYVCPLGMVMGTMMPAAVKKGVGVRMKAMVEVVPEGERPEGAEGALKKRAAAAWAACRTVEMEGVDARGLADRLGLKSAGAVNQLVKAGLLRVVRRRVVVARGWQHAGAAGGEGRAIPELTSEQARAVEGISASLGTFGVHLLHGVTGSGKTEVYLRLIEGAFDRGGGGGTAMVLVPEIALTPQTAERFVSRLGHAGVAVLHSGLSASQRAAEWARVEAGSARVVVGARSAVFAPLRDLRVVVVDEEHDTSYKQDQLLRYHARDVAIKRAQMAGATVVLGSATPSLESWVHAKSGKYGLWKLSRRATGAAMPTVRVIDLAKEWIEQRQLERAARATGEGVSGQGWRGPHSIGPTLERAVGEALGAGGQVMLLLNRRGFANVLVCPSERCGWRLRCDACDATLVLHRRARAERDGAQDVHERLSTRSVDSEAMSAKGGYVRCHHCLAENRTPTVCPACGRGVLMLGAGTQRVEDEIAAKFGGLLGGGYLRLDSDTMSSARDYFEALGRFARGEARLLLGTQMIAKGLDFPNVRLVGVLSADTALWLPDFRAAERTFQLVSQVAGRAGRGERPGVVIVQTYSPEEPAIVHAAKHDYEGFAEEELRTRRRSGLPPAGRMARIVVRDESLAEAEKAGARLERELRGAMGRLGLSDDVKVLGPNPCAIARIAGHHRLEIVLMSRTRAAIQKVLGEVRSRGEVSSDSRTAIDIDPVSLM